MKLLKLSILAVVLTVFGACSGDDDSGATCTQADWVGTYTGTQTCDGITEDVTVTITASGTDAIIIKYVVTAAGSTTELELDPATPTGCDLDQTASSGAATLTVNTNLDGGKLTLTDILSDGTTTVTCTITATRQQHWI